MTTCEEIIKSAKHPLPPLKKKCKQTLNRNTKVFIYVFIIMYYLVFSGREHHRERERERMR